MAQITLEGDEADDDLPTRYWCDRCEAPHLVADMDTHGHGDYLYESREVAEETALKPIMQREDSDGDEEDDEPEKVGEMFDITLSYSADYRFRVPAWSESQAKERAKDLMWDADPQDMIHVHTDARSVKEIYEDDGGVPDGYDPYGSEMLYEVYGEDKDDETRSVSNFPFGRRDV